MKWYQQKTTLTAIAGVCTAIAGYCTGEISLPVLIGAVFAGLATIIARQGIEKSGPSCRGKSGERLEQ